MKITPAVRLQHLNRNPNFFNFLSHFAIYAQSWYCFMPKKNQIEPASSNVFSDTLSGGGYSNSVVHHAQYTKNS